MGGSPHEAGSVFDDPVKLKADWGRVECSLEGRVLGELPILGLRGNVRDVDDLQLGGRRNHSGLKVHDARNGDETADVLEHARSFGGSRDPGGGKEDTGA
jgi:hypothetical protein